jgi:hypothetical protein
VVSRARVGLLVIAIASAIVTSGCTYIAGKRKDEAPAYFSQVTPTGMRYGHNWAERPCFTIDLDGSGWKLEEATADRVVWSRGELHLALYLADNRTGRFAVAGMDGQQALESFMGYELDFVKPRFDFQVSYPPKLAQDDSGVWMQWGWEGHGGKRSNTTVDKPADQRHVIASLWVDPWVLSFDWATTDMNIPLQPTPAMIDVIESLHFYPQCFGAMDPGETWRVGEPRSEAAGEALQ